MSYLKTATVLKLSERVMSRLAALTTERELRVQLKKVPEEFLEASSTIIEQGFILKDGDTADTRIRRRYVEGREDEAEYTLTTKYRPLEQEAETVISKEMYESLSKSILEGSFMKKTRYCKDGWEIDDISEGPHKGEIWAEYEYESTSDLPKIPETWELVEDGSADRLIISLEEEESIPADAFLNSMFGERAARSDASNDDTFSDKQNIPTLRIDSESVKGTSNHLFNVKAEKFLKDKEHATKDTLLKFFEKAQEDIEDNLIGIPDPKKIWDSIM